MIDKKRAWNGIHQLQLSDRNINGMVYLNDIKGILLDAECRAEGYPALETTYHGELNHRCGGCEQLISQIYRYCPNCGSRIIWE